jgi:moderate conductance mechanosensitive channel
MWSHFFHKQLEAFLERFQFEKLIASCVRIVLIILVTSIAMFVIRRVLKKILARMIAKESDPVQASEVEKRYGAVLQLVSQIVRVLLWGIALMITLKELGIDIAPLLASAGVVGLAVGFGAQNLVRDFVTGFFMIIENQIRIGDTVTINGTSGSVEKITLRTITIRSFDGTQHILPNGIINMVSNSTQQYSYCVFDIGIAYKESVDEVVKLVQNVCQELAVDENYAGDMLDRGEVFGLDSFGDSAIVIKGRIKTVPGKQLLIRREFNRRLKLVFEQNKIEMPFPQRTVWIQKES